MLEYLIKSVLRVHFENIAALKDTITELEARIAVIEKAISPSPVHSYVISREGDVFKLNGNVFDISVGAITEFPDGSHITVVSGDAQSFIAHLTDNAGFVTSLEYVAPAIDMNS